MKSMLQDGMYSSEGSLDNGEILFVGVVICDVLIEDPKIVVHTLVRWPISQALYEDISLYNPG